MSLSTAVSNLTAKVTGLYDLVKGQYTKWDNQVKGFTDDISNTFKAEMYRVIYVDAISGDDSNDGKSTRPKRTIQGAIYSTPNGSCVQIILTGGMTYPLDGYTYTWARNIIITKSSTVAELAVITQIVDDSDGTVRAGRFVESKGSGSLQIIDCRIETAQHENAHNQYCALFDVVYGGLNVSLYNCEIQLNDANIAHSYAGISHLSLGLRNVSVERLSSDAKLLYAPSSSSIFSVSNVQLSGNTTDINDLVLGNTDKSNILTNI